MISSSDFPMSFLLVFLRTAVDTFGICGFGLFIMAQPIKLIKLLQLSVIIALLTSPLRFLPLNMGVQIYLGTFIMIIILVKKGGFNIISSSGAVLLGGSTLTILEQISIAWILTPDPANRDLIYGLLITLPSIGFLIILTLVSQTLLNRRKRCLTNSQRPISSANEKTNSQYHLLHIIPAAQLITAMMVLTAIVTSPLRHEIPHMLLIFVSVFIYALILTSWYSCKKWFVKKNLRISPIDVIDLLTLLPVIYLVLAATGGTSSPYKLLYIPLIITNALKPRSIYGIISVGSAVGGLIVPGILSGGINTGWLVEIDVIYSTSFMFIYWLIRHFLSLEKRLYTELEDTRRQFLSNISHDLRTPITTIQGYSEALLDGVIEEAAEKTKYIRLIHNKALGVNRLIEDLFELVNLESHQVKLSYCPISIGELLKQTFDKYETDVNNAGLNLLTDYRDCKGTLINIDSDRIDQVFGNLISNAIKHIPPESTIVLSCETAQNSEIVIFKVKDNGPGIPAEELTRIFQRFYRCSNSKHSTIRGNGLGLAISKEIVEAHGGQIWAESWPGKGTAVCFSLPIAYPHELRRNTPTW